MNQANNRDASNHAFALLTEILRSQPNLLQPKHVDAGTGKETGEFIAALHQELMALSQKQQR